MIIAGDLVNLLAIKHSKDVFVSECKGGPTWFAEHRRLDAWAMKRSWANAAMYGYEIKISRGDWLHDDKWRTYLKYCNLFYFVVPSKKIITPDEVPPEVGLLVASTNNTRLYTIKKAQHRAIEPPADLLIYLLMTRTKVTREYECEGKDAAEKWAAWLTERHEWHDIGINVSIQLHKLLGEAQSAVRLAEEKTAGYELFKQRLAELGHDPKTPVDKWIIRRIIDDLVSTGMPKGLTSNRIETLSGELRALASQLRQLERGT